MKNFFFDFEQVFSDTYEEREFKKSRLKRMFSRIFLALFIYTIISQLLSTVIYVVAAIAMSAERYQAFASNYIVTLLISSGIQYLVAFPTFVILLLRTEKGAYKEKSKLTLKEFIFIFLIGEALMYLGNLIGTFFNGIFGAFSGQMPENSISEIINAIPIWLIFILMVIVGPIVEELIFRKLMIDRMCLFGDVMAILFSAISFGLIHANLYQFFYATFLGIVLGYVYTRTRDVRYTIALHMIINFMGSIVVLPVQEASTKFEALYRLFAAGESFDALAFAISGLIVFIYTNLQYGMVAAGLFLLWHCFKKKIFSISTSKEVYLPNRDILRTGFNNIGAILFVAASVILMIINLFV